MKKFGCSLMILAAILFVSFMVIYGDVGPVDGTSLWIIFGIGFLFFRTAVKKEEKREILKRAAAKTETTSSYYTLNDLLSQREEAKETNRIDLKSPAIAEILEKQPSIRKISKTHQQNNPSKIESIADTFFSEPKRIGYTPNNLFSNSNNTQYTVVKMPQPNSLIKFPRKGRSGKKGYKEDAFFDYLTKYFKPEFEVYNDRHIPINKTSRPYEPDFVLLTEKNKKNIFINIEIDEPYDGWMRTPTHCKGDNDKRDDFFIQRGWIVIRFAEIQIHKEPDACCSYISKIIQSIDNSFQNRVIADNMPLAVPKWESLQANKWAIRNYRETYLGITNFGQRAEITTEYSISDSMLDNLVEEEIPKKCVKQTICEGSLETINNHKRDIRIEFDPIEHRYFIDKNPDTISVTQLIDRFFPEFDTQYWATRKAHERGVPINVLIDEWEAKRLDSATKGTELHAAIESYYNDIPRKAETIEFQQFISFKERYPTMTPYRSEWRIFDEELLIAGTIDMVYEKDSGELYIFDWKRSENVIDDHGKIIDKKFSMAFGELSHLGDNSYNKYCLQQNIYRTILEKRYNKVISSMNLLVMHENLGNYHVVTIPRMDEEVNYILQYAQLRRR